MVQLKPANIINMFITSLQLSSMIITPPNHREIVLHDAILDIITRSMRKDIVVEDDLALQFEDPYASHELEFHEEDDSTSDDETENISQSDGCLPEERKRY
jgi:hypothetical protein